MNKPKKIQYALKNFDVLTRQRFDTPEEAAKFAEHNVSNHPKLNWRDIYQIVEINT